MVKPKFDVNKHILVAEHIKVSAKDKEQILKKYNITADQLPRIALKDPAIAGLKPNVGDIIKVMRKSPTSGQIEFYRCVVND